MTRLLVLPQQIGEGQFSGGSSLRLLGPLEHLRATREDLEVTVAEDDDGGAYDVAVIERFWRHRPSLEAAEELVSRLRRRGVRIVHTIDDNLYELFLERPDDPDAAKGLLAICYLTRHADGVVVSTPTLASVVRRLNPAVQVFPNYVSSQYLGDMAPSRDGKRVRIGYMGTLTHLADLRAILEPLKAALHDEPALAFEVVGVGDAETIRRLLSPYPVEILQPPHHAYDAFFSWFTREVGWDIALAPLVESPINRTKSDIKALDYAAIPAAGVFSDLPAYATQKARGLGRVVANQPQAWYDAIIELARDADTRRRLAERARADLVETRLMEDHAGEFLDAVRAASRRQRAETVREPAMDRPRGD